MKSKKLLAALMTLSLTASLLVGCGGNKAETGGEDGAKEETKMDKNQYLNFVLGAEPKTLDQSKSTDLYSSEILGNVNEALTRSEAQEDGTEKIVPGAAESWETSEDGLTWTFKIRDMKWSDGQKVTAQQFEYGIKRTINPETGSQYAFLLFPIKNAEAFNGGKAKIEDVGVKAIDDNTLEFKLEKPCPYFLDLTFFKVMQPQREDILKQHGEKYGTEADTMVFCGPFTISEWVHNNKVELVKNPEYWDAENVKLEKATMKIIKDETSRMNEVFSGSLDLAGVSKPEWIEKFDATNNFEVKKGYDGSTVYMFFNHQDKYFKNKKIRTAFMLATDQEGMCSTLYRGLAEPATAWCPPAIQINGEEFRKKVGKDPLEELRAKYPDPKALLIEGLKEEGMDPDPAKHTIKFIQSGTNAASKEFAEFEQQNFKNVLGVNIESDFCEWAVYQSRTDQMDYQIASQGWTGDYNDPNTFFDMFLSNANIIPTGWKSAEYDELIKKANEAKDPDERTKLFAEAEKMLIEEVVVSPTAWRFKNTYVRKYVKGFNSSTFGTINLKPIYTDGRES